MPDIRQKLLATFQVEHRDHVDQIRSLLAMIAKTGGQPAEGQLEEAFRRAHTLKGAARVVELGSVEGMAHRLETLFTQVRQGVLPLNKDVVDLVHRALDAIEDCVAGSAESRSTGSFASVVKDIEQILGIKPKASQSTVPDAPTPVPALQPLETVRINAQHFDGLLRSAVELLTESQQQSQITVQLKAIAKQLAGVENGAESLRRASSGLQRSDETARESSAILPRLSWLEREARSVSRQVIAVGRLQQRTSWTMTRQSKQLQRDVWQARMVPAESLIEGYRKMMRDLARDESKQIDFQASSADGHADRRVLEALKDPLMHALRNAVSHGIEFPNERIAKGKQPEGLVTLRIEGAGQRLKITVEDDGRGIDTTRIIEVAVRQEILSQAEAERCSQREVARILFSPGFSTARSITSLSGRGMGLSVVHEAVRRLQGEVDLQPRPGGGMSLQISVPVSISTHSLLLVSCNGQNFAIPTYWIDRLHRVRLKDVETVEGKPAVAVDGQRISLFPLRHLLHLQQESTTGESDMLAVAILHHGGERTAIAVDSFLSQNEAVIQDLGPAAPRDGKISGGVLLEDGSVALVLNPPNLLENSRNSELRAFSGISEPAPKRASSILVVDDSITTRTLEKSILEAHGYRVRVAVDGIEALAQLRAEKADLVISDVQMPRMDGFELLEAIKKDRNLCQIPVVVVTSLERGEDQERGLRLGADAYIVKRKFDQGELLATIRQIL
ncbi:MAG TPA: response regulator [Bryobacteraceae bacterium]|nr:response regulator [Bryobacteraceae bacterium]